MNSSGTAAASGWLSPVEQAAWRGYLEMNRALTARLNRDLATEHGLSLAEFGVLVALSEHPDGRMRVLELARAAGWEKSRMSHQLRRMQERGLIERSTCEEDRRGAVVALSSDGRRTIQAAAPAHVASVRKYLFDVLDDDAVHALAAIASGVVAGLGGACAPEEECVADAGACGSAPSPALAGVADGTLPAGTVDATSTE